MLVEKIILPDMKYIPCHYNKNYMITDLYLVFVSFSLCTTAQNSGWTKVNAWFCCTHCFEYHFISAQLLGSANDKSTSAINLGIETQAYSIAYFCVFIIEPYVLN